jgi:membrane-associated phospholipid phosphatase
MRPHSTLPHSKLLVAAALATSILACQPDADSAGLVGPITASRGGIPTTETLASPGWQGTAATLVAQASLPATVATRMYSLVGVAQYLAVQRVADSDDETGRGRSRPGADRGAVAGASAVVLTYLFPTKAQALEDMVTAQRGVGDARSHLAFARGEAVGRAVGAEIVTRGRADGFSTPFTSTPPVGAGFWFSEATPPSVAGGPLAGTRPWFLTSASQFRSAPPPAFGSAAFQADLAEIRAIAQTRTALQVQMATSWAQGVGTPTTAAFWLRVATDGITQHGYSERRATHLYALLSATMFDAQIGCWDSKEIYWFIRPWQADAAITVVAAVGKPNHPAYPSGHSCISASAAEVLSAFFPAQRAHLDSMVTEAGLSRMYGGIHYQFDIDAGAQLGRSVARFAMRADRSGHSVLSPDDEEEGDGPR